MLTVKELRDAIMDLDDDDAVMIPGTSESDYDKQYYSSEVEILEDRVVIR